MTLSTRSVLFFLWFQTPHVFPLLSSQCRPDICLSSRLFLDPRHHCGHHEQGIQSQYNLFFFLLPPVQILSHFLVLIILSEQLSSCLIMYHQCLGFSFNWFLINWSVMWHMWFFWLFLAFTSRLLFSFVLAEWNRTMIVWKHWQLSLFEYFCSGCWVSQ